MSSEQGRTADGDRQSFDQAVRAAERELAAQGEAAYRTMVAAWQPRPPAVH